MYKFHIVYILDTFMITLSFWLLFLIFCAKALPSGLILAINHYAFLIALRLSPKDFKIILAVILLSDH